MKTMLLAKAALKPEDKKGFTLVEVIVVLVILAILMAIAVPSLTGYIDKARYSNLIVQGASAKTAVQTIITMAYANDGYYELDSGRTLYFWVDKKGEGWFDASEHSYGSSDPIEKDITLAMAVAELTGNTNYGSVFVPWGDLAVTGDRVTGFNRLEVIFNDPNDKKAVYADGAWRIE
jgi:prepilin-type N-terminal cleavage/methylation domain-containing protein